MQKLKITTSITLAILCLVWPSFSYASLKGTYTIDPAKSASSTNYKNIGSAVSDLMNGSRNDGGSANGKGISGNVTFNIASGIYNEQILIGKIAGTSSSNGIVFQSAAGDSSKVIWSYPASNSAGLTNYVLRLDSTQYVTIKGITLTRTGTGYLGRVIQFSGNTKGINILNNRIIGLRFAEFQDPSDCIYSDFGKDSLTTISNNLIRYGAYGLFWQGSSLYVPKIRTMVKGNIFDSTLLSISTLYQSDLTIDGNQSLNSRAASFGDVHLQYCNTNILIQNNKLVSGNVTNAFMFEYCQSTKYGGFTVANNVINLNSTAFCNGIEVYEALNQTYYYNTIYVKNGSCLYLHGDIKVDVTLYNNIFASPNYSFFQGDPANYYTYSSDFNNIYQSSKYTLSGWGSSNEKHSSFQNPQFKSLNDLHALNSALVGVANTITPIKVDADGKKRNSSKPYPGAYELTTVFKTDIGILSLDSPTYAPCPGFYNVYASLYNYGTDTLKSATVNFNVNGIPLGSSKWTGNIPKGQSGKVSLGTIKLSAGVSYSIRAWTSNPNGVTDSNATNDSIAVLNFKTGLSGTYNVGGTSPDYNTLKDAVTDLNKRGMCGAVTFSIRDGYYRGQLVMNSIVGASSTNTITFQSASKDSSKVIIDMPSGPDNTNGDACLLCLNSTSWLNFKQVTLSRSGINRGTEVVELRGNSNNLSFSGCRIIGNKNSSTPLIKVGRQYIDSNSINTLLLKNNVIKLGLFALYSDKSIHNQSILNNVVDSLGFGFYASGKNVIIKGNTINCFNISPLSYNAPYSAITTTSFPGNTAEISYNKITTNTGNAAFKAFCGLSSTLNIFNNEIICTGSSSSNDVFVTAGAGRTYFASNTILRYGVNVTNPTMELDIKANTDSTIFRNNIIVNTSKWAVLDIRPSSGSGAKFISANNDLYANSPALLLYNLTPYTTLSAYKSASGQENNSVSVDPLFKSNTTLIPGNAKLDGTALTSKLITDDINHITRNISKPDMGAYEFTATGNDAGIAGLDSASRVLCTGSSQLSVTLINYGANTLTAASINWSVNGVSKTSFSWLGSLAQGQKTVVKLSGLSISTGAPYTIKVWTSSPNGQTDDNKTNDSSTTIATSGLNGIYTIGGSSPDYKTFTAAVNDLKSRGVCSPVIFKVRDGIYQEALTLAQFPGVSANNTVTFTSENADSTKVILQLATSYNTYTYLIEMNGADWISFNKMSLITSDSTVTNGVIDLVGGAHHNSFISCIIRGVDINNKLNHNAFHPFFNSKDTANTIKFCHIYGNVLLSSSQTRDIFNNLTQNYESGTIIENNLIEGGVLTANGQDGIKIRYNQILGGNINISGCINSSECSFNYINSKNQQYGISAGGFNGTSSAPSLIANNMICLSTGYSANGIFCTASDYCNIYNNNVNLLSATGAALNTYNTGNSRIQNNILVCKGGGAAWYNSGTAPASDYNNFYANGTNLITDASGGNYTLKSWRTATTHDAHSLNEVPFYVSDTDLHVKNVDMLGAGISVSQVTLDFDNQSRKNPPAIGADEFNGLIRDLLVAKILSPQGFDCGDSQLVTKVMLVNVGINSLSNFTIGVKTSGAASYSLIDTVTQTINARDTLIYTFVKKMNVSSGGLLNITVYNAYKPDQDHKNDTARTSIFLQNKTGIVSTVSAGGCPGSTLKIVASAAANKTTKWFTASTGGSPIANGDTLTLKNVTANKTYYAEADNINNVFHFSDPDLSTSNAKYVRGSAGLNFNALTAFTLDSLSIYPDSSASITFNLYDAAGKMLNTVSRSYTVTNAYQKIRLAIGFPVAAGKYYRLTATQSKGGLIATTFNYNKVSIIPGIIEANLNGLAASPGANFFNNYLFDFQITSGNPTCGRRTPVKVVVDKPSFNLIKDKLSLATYDLSVKNPLDNVCANVTAIYDVKSGYLNRDYGKTWKVIKYSLNTASGTPGLDTAFTKTDTGSAAKIFFTPHAGTTDSTYILTVTVHSIISGCDSVYKRSIKVLPAPKPAYTFINACDGKPVSFTDQSIGNGLTYLWSFGDSKTATTLNPTHTYLGAGSYTVSLRVTNTSGCVDSVLQGVQVYQRPKASFTTTGACQGSDINFSNKSTIPSGDSATYRWNFGDTTAINTAASPLHKYIHPGGFTVRLKVSTNHGCTDSTAKLATINPTPYATFTFVANKKTYNFNADDSFQTSYHWDFGDSSLNSAIQAPQYTYKTTGKRIVTLTVANSFGCEATLSKTINVSEVGINPVNNYINKLKVYPNPFADNLNIGFDVQEQATFGLSITDLSGRELYRQADKILTTGQHTLQLNEEELNFSPGMYMLQIRINGNTLISKPITKLSTR